MWGRPPTCQAAFGLHKRLVTNHNDQDHIIHFSEPQLLQSELNSLSHHHLLSAGKANSKEETSISP